ncbi:hypothetical protein MCUN1_002753 [Malassezia cuniculi]|uniref:Pentafunctional AROM polypeptide n=1 Tax=Malassezia cuniculi TaxID=948313 RepID=A0AAF0EVM3_9BASI|nr:hypothetical protein MCUN1_002753 [Malassezia cuniculi]
MSTEGQGSAKVPNYHAPPFESPVSGATIHELRCLKARIHTGYHLVPHIAKTLLATLPASAYVIFTDTNLAKLGAIDKFTKAFEDAGITGKSRLLSYVLQPGEESKCRETKAAMEDWMLEQRLTRDTVVLAVGGGVIGDLVGFVSATFMRGLRLVQVPTTLLAMVDSAVGGKTAIDHPHGKNLIGAFHQPEYVFVDAAWLLTLPEREFSNGMAEVVKTAAIWDADDFDKLETQAEAIRAAVLSEEARSGPPNQGLTLETRTTAQTLLLDVIRGSIGVKAHIVNIDEKETGLRNLVNFGHSIGHAIEAVLTPGVLHGECVSIGMILEAEIARSMHGLTQVSISRLVRCLKNYGLPVSLRDPLIVRQANAPEITVSRLLDIMRVDKKNAGSAKKIVLLSRIGGTVEERASTVPDAEISRVLASDLLVRPIVPVPAAVPPHSLRTPGSKSISNRALVLAALAGGTCRIQNLLHSDDTQVMMTALRELRAADFAWEDGGRTLVVSGRGGRVLPPLNGAPIYLQNAGTAARFITTVCAMTQPDTVAGLDASVVVTGNARMQERPIGPLVDALRANGTEIAYQNNEGCLPLKIDAAQGGFRGGHIKLAANVSSQYVSSILLCAPYAAEEVVLELVGGKVISQPYIDMTMSIMDAFGITVERLIGQDGAPLDVYRIPKGVYTSPVVYEVESDASSATYPLALAAITGTQCTVPLIGSASLQGDARFARDVLAPMGCKVEQTATSTTVTGPPVGTLKALGEIDMEPMTDAFLTAAVLFAVATGGPTRIYGIANQRVKESNRIRAVADELAKFGVNTEEDSDGLTIIPTPISELKAPEVFCYDDHRIAMAFSVLAAVAPSPGVTILDKRCVEKTWPSWWDDAASLGLAVAGTHVDEPLVPLSGVTQDSIAALGAGALPTPYAYAPDATIVCIGMRASGKSHVGKELAQLLGRKFVDADVLFEQEYDIGAFVREHGWEKFRAEEVRRLAELLRDAPTGHVLALGGGAVETPAAREMLTEFGRTGPVVHVVRDLDAIVKFLSTSDRPAYGEPVEDVYARRLPWYRQCATCEVYNAANEANYSAASALAAQLRTVLGGAPELDTSARTYFVSLTFPDVRVALDALTEASAGADVLELRVDLLSETGAPVREPHIPSEDLVRAQVACLRAHTSLPVLFTVRSVSQGGMFPDEAEDAYFELVRLGLRLGCEYIDVEMHRSATRLSAVRAIKGHARLVASYHDTVGALRWDSPSARAIYSSAARMGDLVKIVGSSNSTMSDNLALEAFRAQATTRPLIAINMGTCGQLSRVLNTVLTPVTHAALPARAAPGQLSIREINAARHLIGQEPARRFCLLGTPIAHSMSPLIHNTGFELLGLPHKYELQECDTLGDAQAAFLRAPDFGGASVTIPHKLAIMGLLDEVAPEAQVIGAVNTVIPLRDENGHVRALRGDNTDWRAIEDLARTNLAHASGEPLTTLVIGAGGSARAAIYAMHRLGSTRILLANRTHEKAVALAADVPAEWRVEAIHLTEAPAHEPRVIVSNVPASGTSLEGGAGEIVIPTALLGPAGGVAIDMAYKPEKTPLLELAERARAAGHSWVGVPGLSILLEQAYHQFRLWTNAPPPSALIAPRVWNAYRA